jgi:hypothetical protein
MEQVGEDPILPQDARAQTLGANRPQVQRIAKSR